MANEEYKIGQVVKAPIDKIFTNSLGVDYQDVVDAIKDIGANGFPGDLEIRAVLNGEYFALSGGAYVIAARKAGIKFVPVTIVKDTGYVEYNGLNRKALEYNSVEWNKRLWM